MRIRVSVALLLLPALVAGQDLTIEKIQEGISEGRAAFDELKIGKAAEPVAFDITLGEEAVTIDGQVFDGLRFVCPEIADEADFVWYFNAPAPWGNWYVVPAGGKPSQAFRGWMTADRVYQTYDEPAEKDRLRVLQTLRGDYFTPGEEYLLWFRRTAGDDRGRLRGMVAFSTKEEKGDWEHDDVEKALGLKDGPPEAQVAALDSRGGRILLDGDFFDRADAANRIDSALFSIRRTQRMQGGFFISVQTAVPPCKTRPSLASIREKYGDPDFIRTGREKADVAKHAGGTQPDDDESGSTLHHYDHFAFEVETAAKEPVVLRIHTFGSDFSAAHPPEKGEAYAQVDLQNLTVFHREGKEVGRAYYFLEGGKAPYFTTEPPVGAYRSGLQVLHALGKGRWNWVTHFPDGKISREVPFVKNRMEGPAKGFYETGKPRFVASYRRGELHGEVTEYDEEGKVSRRMKFKDGERIEGD